MLKKKLLHLVAGILVLGTLLGAASARADALGERCSVELETPILEESSRFPFQHFILWRKSSENSELLHINNSSPEDGTYRLTFINSSGKAFSRCNFDPGQELIALDSILQTVPDHYGLLLFESASSRATPVLSQVASLTASEIKQPSTVSRELREAYPLLNSKSDVQGQRINVHFGIQPLRDAYSTSGKQHILFINNLHSSPLEVEVLLVSPEERKLYPRGSMRAPTLTLAPFSTTQLPLEEWYLPNQEVKFIDVVPKQGSKAAFGATLEQIHSENSQEVREFFFSSFISRPTNSKGTRQELTAANAGQEKKSTTAATQSKEKSLPLSQQEVQLQSQQLQAYASSQLSVPVQRIEPAVQTTNGPACGFLEKPSADLNQDGWVNGLDYDIWRLNFGRNPASPERGDVNSDNRINIADYTVLRDVMGRETQGCCQPSLDIRGDVNSDGKVDVVDIQLWQRNYGASNAQRFQGDANGDGLVNMSDFTIIRDNVGAASSNCCQSGPGAELDLNSDGLVDQLDFSTCSRNIGANRPSRLQGDIDGNGQITTTDCEQIRAAYKLPTQICCENGPGAKGDINGDKKVDASDYQVWVRNYGRTNAQFADGDANRDGRVDIRDYTIIFDAISKQTRICCQPGAGYTADVDGSGFVDIGDLAVVRNNYGRQNAQKIHGDTNKDGVVNSADYTRVRDNLRKLALSCDEAIKRHPYDLNKDGYVDSADLEFLDRYRSDLPQLSNILNPGLLQSTTGDLNRDGIIDLRDRNLLLSEIDSQESPTIIGAEINLGSVLSPGAEMDLRSVVRIRLSSGAIVGPMFDSITWSSSNAGAATIQGTRLRTGTAGSAEIRASFNYDGRSFNLSNHIDVQSTTPATGPDQSIVPRFTSTSESARFEKSCGIVAERYSVRAKLNDAGKAIGTTIFRSSSVKHENYSQEELDRRWLIELPRLSGSISQAPQAKGFTQISEDKQTLWTWIQYSNQNETLSFWELARVDITNVTSPRLIEHTVVDLGNVPYPFNPLQEENLGHIKLTNDTLWYFELGPRCLGGLVASPEECSIVSLTSRRIANGVVTKQQHQIETGDWRIITGTFGLPGLDWGYMLVSRSRPHSSNGHIVVEVGLAKINSAGQFEYLRDLERLEFSHYDGGPLIDRYSFTVVHGRAEYVFLLRTPTVGIGVDEETTEFPFQAEYRSSSPVRGQRSHYIENSLDSELLDSLPTVLYRAPDGRLLGTIKPFFGQNSTVGLSETGHVQWEAAVALDHPVFLENGLIYWHSLVHFPFEPIDDAGIRAWFYDTNPQRDIMATIDISSMNQTGFAISAFGIWGHTNGSFLLPRYVHRSHSVLPPQPPFDSTHVLVEQGDAIETRGADPMLPTQDYLNQALSCLNGTCTNS